MRRTNLLKTIAVTATMIFMITGCNKSTVSIPETTVSTMETTSIETSGEDVTDPSKEVEKNEQSTSASVKSTESSTTESTSKDTTTSTTVNESNSTKTTEESTTVAPTETTTKATKATESTETTTEVTTKQTEKATEKTTEKTTEKQTEAHKHNYTSSVTKASTCTNEGIMTYTCSCGNSYTEVIGKIAHQFGGYTYNNDATYDADGTETAICTVCGERTTRTASGTKLVHTHSYTETITTTPTCTENGIKTYTCGCGNSYTEVIPATGHQFSDYVYNNDATTSADGTKTRHCTVCDVRETITAEGTKKSLPSWYDEHSQQLNTTTGSQIDGSLEAWFTDNFDWEGAAMGCWDFGYSMTIEGVGDYAEGFVMHGYLYK